MQLKRAMPRTGTVLPVAPVPSMVMAMVVVVSVLVLGVGGVLFFCVRWWLGCCGNGLQE